MSRIGMNDQGKVAKELYRESEHGVTRMSLEFARKMVRKTGRIVRVELLVAKMTDENWVRFESVYGDAIECSGFCWGYCGEGPRGLETILKEFGFKGVDMKWIAGLDRSRQYVIEKDPSDDIELVVDGVKVDDNGDVPEKQKEEGFHLEEYADGFVLKFGSRHVRTWEWRRPMTDEVVKAIDEFKQTHPTWVVTSQFRRVQVEESHARS